MSMTESEWLDVLNDLESDPVPAATVNLPDDNETAGQKEAAGHEASGALSEDDDPAGVKTEEAGDRKDFTGDKPSDFDDLMNFFNKANSEDEGDEEDDSDEDDEKKGSDDDEASKSAPLKGEPKGKEEDEDPEDKELKDLMNLLDENPDPVENPTVNLPKENEKERKEDEEASGYPAAGALPEDDDPAGTKDQPAGDHPDFTGDKPSEFDDLASFLDESDSDSEDEEDGDDKPDDKKDDEDKDKKDDDKKDDDESDDDQPVEDFASFFVDDNGVDPEGLPKGSTAKPAEPVDGNGNAIDPNGEQDLPDALTVKPINVVSSPEGGHDGELANAMSVFDEDNSRFFFGDFEF